MTRAEEILALAEAIGDPQPFKKATNPFKHQYSHKPGQKIPTHQKMRQQKIKMRMQRSKASFGKPWASSAKPARDKVSQPLTSQTNKTPIHKIG